MTTMLILLSLLVSSFTVSNKMTNEYDKLQQLESRALRNPAGKIYIYDLAGRKDCNKTTVKYLGIAHTKKGKRYKVLTSFFVFNAAATCHGTSRIKIFDMKNRYVGEYNVGMPEGLPDILRKNKLLYAEKSEDCDLRTSRIINLGDGLPKRFFIPCLKTGGDLVDFSDGN